MRLTLHPGTLTLDTLRDVHQQHITLALANSAHSAIENSAAHVQKVLTQNKSVYGINTGFGLLANTKIAENECRKLSGDCLTGYTG